MNDQLKQTAEALVGHCQNHTEAEALKTLYADNVVSVEAVAMPGAESASVEGIPAIEGKHAWWEANFEVHDASVEGPMYHGEDRFSVIFGMDTTNKQSGERSQMKEVAIYTVNDAGKISREEFFYTV